MTMTTINNITDQELARANSYTRKELIDKIKEFRTKEISAISDIKLNGTTDKIREAYKAALTKRYNTTIKEIADNEPVDIPDITPVEAARVIASKDQPRQDVIDIALANISTPRAITEVPKTRGRPDKEIPLATAAGDQVKRFLINTRLEHNESLVSTKTQVEILNRLKYTPPTVYPSYVYTKGLFKRPTRHQSIAITEYSYTLVKSRPEYDAYLEKLFDRLLSYDVFGQEGVSVEAGNIDVIQLQTHFIDAKDLETQQIRRVGELSTENCVINCLRMYNKNLPDTIYKKLPKLVPTPDKRVFLEDEPTIDRVAKTASVSLELYTPLGRYHNKPWKTFGYKGKKIIKLQVRNEHATMMNPTKIARIQYVPQDELILTDATNIIDYGKNPDDTIQYIIKTIDGVNIIYKSFRPSQWTNHKDIDTDIKTALFFDETHVAAYMFKKQYDLNPIADPDIRNLVKQAEMFIGRGVVDMVNPIDLDDATEYDQKKNYWSAKKSAYYQGFPTRNLIPSRFDHTTKDVAFVIVSAITIENPHLKNAFSHIYQNYNPRVLFYPLYRYLVDNGATIDVEFALTSNHQDIDMVEFISGFVNQAFNSCPDLLPPGDLPNYDQMVDHITESTCKRIGHKINGQTISGGLAETKIIKINDLTEIERDQHIKECNDNEYRFNINPSATLPDRYDVNVFVPNKSKGLFHYHSAVLGYAAIHVLSKWVELANQGKTIIAYNVDALVVQGKQPIKASSNNQHWKNQVGDWSATHQVKAYYKLLKPTTPDDETVYRTNYRWVREQRKSLEIPDNIRPFPEDVFNLILGAGGLGKSYEVKINPYYKQAIGTPTRMLRDDHKRMYMNTVTAHKYFQFTMLLEKYLLMRGSYMKPARVIVIDEAGMFTESQWDRMIEVAKLDNTIIIALGDFEQIMSSIGSSPVNYEYFKKRGFNITTMTRDPNNTKLRHTYEYGSFLDSLRGLDISKQVQKITSSGRYMTVDLNDIIENGMTVVVDKHSHAHKIHQLAKAHYTANSIPVPCVSIKKDKRGNVKRGSIVNVDPTSKFIFWDRKSMTTVVPEGMLYEPNIAITVDSTQGKTYAVGTTTVVHMGMVRHGSVYTAITRNVSGDDVYILPNMDVTEKNE